MTHVEKVPPREPDFALADAGRRLERAAKNNVEDLALLRHDVVLLALGALLSLPTFENARTQLDGVVVGFLEVKLMEAEEVVPDRVGV